ncbi:MAG: hypothetical protein NTV86_14545 [Planctomycetota bacterium]|nr:hypothetical protein [Planctomycetota bacterium]
MVGDAKAYGYEDIVASVAALVAAQTQKLARSVGWDTAAMGGAFPRRMLRTRLAARIDQGRAWLDRQALVNLCAATELLHLASLCHDTISNSISVLMGDLLLVDSTDMVIATRGGQHVKSFLDKAKEVLETDIQHLAHQPGRAIDLPTAERLAWGKSGPLFAFTAGLGGAGEGPLAGALAQAGYRVGAACQLGDDLGALPDAGAARERIAALCDEALAGLTPWPAVRAELAGFLLHDFRPPRAFHLARRGAPIEAAP